MLDVRSMSFHDRHAQIVPPTSFQADAGELTFLEVPTPAGRTAAALILSGRMAPERGELRLDDDARLSRLRRSAAIVDAEGITAPEHFMSVRRVVAESLGLRPLRSRLASRRRTGSSPRDWMALHGYTDLADEPVDSLPAADRIDLLVRLAFTDPQVRLAVVDSPDRHDISAEELTDTLAALVDEESERSVVAVVQHAPRRTGHEVVVAGDARTDPEEEPVAEPEPAPDPEDDAEKSDDGESPGTKPDAGKPNADRDEPGDAEQLDDPDDTAAHSPAEDR